MNKYMCKMRTKKGTRFFVKKLQRKPKKSRFGLGYPLKILQLLDIYNYFGILQKLMNRSSQLTSIIASLSKIYKEWKLST